MSQHIESNKIEISNYLQYFSKYIQIAYGMRRKNTSLIITYIDENGNLYITARDFKIVDNMIEMMDFNIIPCIPKNLTIIYGGITKRGYNVYTHYLDYQQKKIYKFKGFQDIYIITD